MVTRKPTYEELRQRVSELETVLQELKRARSRSQSTFREVEHLALLGHWELDLRTNHLSWSDEIYHIFELDPRSFGATYEAFLERVHPDDRPFVDRSYTASVQERRPYDIVHRLLLPDGTIKYVRERCETRHDDQDRPIRSLGTVQDITADMRAKQGFAGIVGREPAMQDVFEIIGQVARATVPVLVQGESGTGKELVARAIHDEGPRAQMPFVPVNCAALPEGLLESELFGHVRGAFTGATRDKKGRFALADGGTLFLDEVGEMPAALQAKLLRVLQEGTFERVGDEKTLRADVRVVSATNRDLKEEIRKGQFREDLFFRLAVVPIQIPPLRDRRSDIPLLVEHLLTREASEGRHSGGISRQAEALLMDHSWPGNVRELQSAIYYAVIRSMGDTILPEHLPPEALEDAQRKKRRMPALRERIGADAPAGADSVSRGRGRKLTIEDVQVALEKTGGNKVKAAKLLGVGRATLYRYLNRQG